MTDNNHFEGVIVLRYLLIIFFASVLLYLGRTLFIPFFFGLMIAIIMYPISRWLEIKGCNKSIAIALCLLIVTTLLTTLVALLVWQLNVFQNQSQGLLLKLDETFKFLQQWAQKKVGVIVKVSYNLRDNAVPNLGGMLISVLQTIFTTMFTLFLVPVFTALFLYHRHDLVRYLQFIIPAEYQEKLNDILQQTIHTYFRFIKGMILVYLFVGILNTLGLWALGLKNPLLFGMVCAVMTIIPYVGIIVSSLLPIAMIWLQTDNFLYPLGVVAVLVLVQYLEANVIFPRLVGRQLNVGTLAILIAIIVGSVIWGAAGMVLFIPFVGILKILSDQLPRCKSLSLLLGR